VDSGLHALRRVRCHAQDPVGVHALSGLPRFPSDPAEFAEVVDSVSRSVDSSRRLPDWPFRAPGGFLTIYEYDRVLGGQFGRVLESLAADFGDSDVYLMGVVPEASYYVDSYDRFPAFRVGRGSLEASYGAGMRHEPNGDPTGALGDSLDVVVMAGSSGAWSIWAQRDWEIGLLLTPVPSGSWRSTDVPSFDRDTDLNSIRSPAGWGLALSEGDLATFWRNARERGSGH
jgi:hypothetical protein